jgi:hypothetical protein
VSSLAHTAVIEPSPLQVRTRTGADAVCRVASFGAVLALVVGAPF